MQNADTLPRFGLWLDGKEVQPPTWRTLAVPYDGRAFASIGQAELHHVAQAIAGAERAAPIMRAMPRAQRSRILRLAMQLLAERKAIFAETIASESGKPLREALAEVDRGVSTLQFSAEEASHLAGHEVPIDAAPGGVGKMGMAIREPLGIIAAITPFNFPLNLSLHKIGPALGSGNVVVHKPASATPATAILLARLFHDAGLPAGALQVLPGPGALIGDALSQHPKVAMITFTGSADVGLAIRQRAPWKRVTLELGSNSGVMVEADADLELAIQKCVTGAYANAGQVCISVQRIFVQQAIAAQFAEGLAHAAANLTIGDPLQPDTQLSGLIHASETDRVAAWMANAQAKGAKPLLAPQRLAPTVLTPALFTDVPRDCELMQQEAFGPVAGLRSYSSLEEGIAMLNDTEFGLQASIFTRDLQRAFQAAHAAQVGGFLINDVPQFRVDQMPYGGTKRSGTGREGPRYAMEEMTQCKLIVW